MHQIMLINRKLESTAPYFTETPEGQVHNESLNKFKTDYPDLFVSHDVFKSFEKYISVWVFVDEDQSNRFRQKLDEVIPEMLAYRNAYIAENNQDFWAKTTKSDGTETLIRVI